MAGDAQAAAFICVRNRSKCCEAHAAQAQARPRCVKVHRRMAIASGTAKTQVCEVDGGAEPAAVQSQCAINTGSFALARM
jgi:hypothetical protein